MCLNSKPLILRMSDKLTKGCGLCWGEMGRTKRTKGVVNVVENTKKKHKKSKKKKHFTPEVEEEEVKDTSPIHRPIKLKIKLGDQLISSSSLNATIESPIDPEEVDSTVSESHSLGDGASCSSPVESTLLDVEDGTTLEINNDKDKTESDVSVGKEGGEVGSELEEDDGDEEAWLDALEAGNVNERGYLPQKKDSSSLTARQRAMLGGEGLDCPGEELMELPIGRSNEELTEEMLLKKTENNRKRRLAAQKRKEKRKAETVRKLLEKQSTKKKEAFPHKKVRVPHIRYINSSRYGETGLSLPPGMEFPMYSIKSHLAPVSVQCAVDGCHRLKKYSDSLTKLPLCSLECYRTLHTQKHQKVIS